MLARALAALAVLASLLLCGDLARQVVVTSAERIRTPDPADLQGAIVRDHALRVRAGLPLYAAPDATFCPLLYTPLYYHACAAVMALAGPDLAACRITSVLLLGAAVLVMVLFVAEATRSVLAVAAVLAAVPAGYEACGFFHDAPRVDAASSLLVVVAVLAGARAGGARGGVVVGALLTAAFFAKQSTAAFAVPFLAAILLRGRSVAIAAAGTYVVLTVGLVAAATALTDAWFWRFCILMPGDHPLPLDRVLAVFRADWSERLRAHSVAVLVVAAALGGRAWTARRDPELADPHARAGDRTLSFLLAAFVCVLVMTSLSHGREGGTVKALIPACLVLAVIVPIGLWRVVRHAKGGAADAAAIAASALFAFLATEGRFEREEAVLTPEARGAWDRLAEVLEPHAEAGEVWTALSGFPEYPGQPMRPGELALNDYLRSERNPMPPAVENAVAAREFAAIVLHDRLSREGGDRTTRFAELVQTHYRAAKRVTVPVGILGKKVPAGVYVPARDRDELAGDSGG